jgi:hypothetical protein
MTHRPVLRSASVFVVTLLLSAPAHAQLFRSYLTPTGNDANPCTLVAPCRLLPAALAAVADGGEIWILESANYNTAPVNITKSVTILAVPGALGSVLAMAGDAIDIATAGVKVALRNLVIVPLPGGGGVNGINMTAGAGLTVDNCLIANLPQSGIVVNTAAVVRVTDTTIRDNGGTGLYYGLLLANGASATVTRATISGNNNFGVFVYGITAGTTTTADIADSTLDGNASGVVAWALPASAVLKVSVRDSRLVRNGSNGVVAESNNGAPVTLSVSNNIISNNGTGIAALLGGSKVWASGNTVSDNVAGLFNNGGLFESAGNNAVRNNGADTSGAIVVIATK